MEDTLSHALVDSFPKSTPMGVTAENLAKKYNITRKECDDYALLSQQRWAKAQDAGFFKNEICKVDIKGKKDVEAFDVDEAPRRGTTIDGLAKLSSVFMKEGVVTAGYP
jgi:acetyl-CoA acyltransferase 2